MTQQEMIDHLRGGPVPHRMVPGGLNKDETQEPDKLQVMDLTMMPGGLRSLFDDQGVFVGGDEPENVVAEHGVPETAEGAIASRAKSEDAEESTKDSLRGKLPDDFPGLSALDAAGIHTYAQLRKAGDVTEVPGIDEVTAGKIAEALG